MTVISPRDKAMAKSKAAAGRSGSAGVPESMKESLEMRKKRARKIIAALKRLYPEATCALHHDSALHLLIATILSAQSTDETVNKVTPIFFARYPDADAAASASPADVEKIIYPTGFFRQKTRSVIGACRTIVERFGGEVPATMEELVELPGVARKTANVLLGTWFGKNDGVVVDTHVGRLAHRLALTWRSKGEKDAVKIEQDLMELLPRKEWTFISHALIWHGRRVCAARKPRCAECKLNKLCPAAFTFEPSGEGKPAGKRRSAAGV
jgi:endonuclease III